MNEGKTWKLGQLPPITLQPIHGKLITSGGENHGYSMYMKGADVPMDIS